MPPETVVLSVTDWPLSMVEERGASGVSVGSGFTVNSGDVADVSVSGLMYEESTTDAQ